MNELKLYNTLSRKKEAFKPLMKGQVGMYSCGPTVYNYAHIGNLRTYIFNDLLKRSLIYLEYKVKHVMNITDVDDKTIKGSRDEKIPLKEFTEKYEAIFLQNLKDLNIIKPDVVIRATDSIEDMVVLIKELMDKGYAYKTSDGIYFSIDKFKGYGKLANLEKGKKTKSRISSDEYDKSNAKDFALWKFYTKEDGDVFWETQIGKGRPGWHIECSAMSMKLLGTSFDIHTGAIDLIFPHHTNEIAQSEAATGKLFVKYWLHAGFLNMKDEKMSKSLGNILTLRSVEEKGYSPFDFRYMCLLAHYRSQLVFSIDNLVSAKNALERMRRKVIGFRVSEKKGKDKMAKYGEIFLDAINDDLNMPVAMQVVWAVLDDEEFDSVKKLDLLEKFDSVLGLDIRNMKEGKVEISPEVKRLIEEREKLRKEKKWKEADKIRDKIKEKGYLVEDSTEGIKISVI